MKETEVKGTLQSRVHCIDCKRIIKTMDTQGLPTLRAIEELQYRATMHERKHPTHEVSVIIYRDESIR